MAKHKERSEFSELVRERRTALGLSQEELSERVGMSQEWASMVELGRIRQPRIATLKRLAPVLGVSIEDLVIAVGYATSKKGAERVIPATIDDPLLEANFLALSELSGKRQEELLSLIRAMKHLDEQEFGE